MCNIRCENMKMLTVQDWSKLSKQERCGQSYPIILSKGLYKYMAENHPNTLGKYAALSPIPESRDFSYTSNPTQPNNYNPSIIDCSEITKRKKMPQRIQLKRTKGWRMPSNTKKVDRTTRFGNPYKIGEVSPTGQIAPDAEGATGLFQAMLNDPELRSVCNYPDDLSELRGKNLACWCSGNHCHADVLLEHVN